jgi:hypothetical protein
MWSFLIALFIGRYEEARCVILAKSNIDLFHRVTDSILKVENARDMAFWTSRSQHFIISYEIVKINKGNVYKIHKLWS